MWAVFYKKPGHKRWQAYAQLFSTKGNAGTKADKLKEQGYKALPYYIHLEGE